MISARITFPNPVLVAEAAMARFAWALVVGCAAVLAVFPVGCGRKAEVAPPPLDEELPPEEAPEERFPAGLDEATWGPWEKAGAEFRWYGRCANGLERI